MDSCGGSRDVVLVWVGCLVLSGCCIASTGIKWCWYVCRVVVSGGAVLIGLGGGGLCSSWTSDKYVYTC